MVFSSLEQDLHEFRDQEISTLQNQFQNQQLEEESKFNLLKEEFLKNIQQEKSQIISNYTNSIISSAKQEANASILLKKKEEKEIVIEQLVEKYLKKYNKISELVISSALEILQCTKKDIFISCNTSLEKIFSKIVSKSQIKINNSFSEYNFNIEYKHELVRFNLKDEITKIVEVNLE